MEDKVYLNGNFVEQDKASISALSPGFLFGLGLFETMRWYNGHIVYLDTHLRRIHSGAKTIGVKFPCSLDRLRSIIEQAARTNKIKDGYVKLVIWKEQEYSGILVIAKDYHSHGQDKYRKGFVVCIASLRQQENNPLAQVKSTNRILYQLSMQEAVRSGFDEALILNNRGYLAEGSRSNIFFVKDNELFTPSLECGCLEGVTRKVVFDLAAKSRINLIQGNFTKQNLLDADEAFLTNSLMGVMPLTSVEKENIGNGKCGQLTKILIKKYSLLLR